MKKAILLVNNSNERIFQVYPQSVLNQIKSKVNLFDEVINSNNLSKFENVVKEAEIIFSTWGMPYFSDEQISDFFPNLKVIFYAAGTVKGFAENFIKRGIKVLSAWQANGIPTAEFATTQIVLANKGFYQAQHLVKQIGYYQAARSLKYPGNYDIKVGLLGAGAVGSYVIKLLKAMELNLELLVFDPFLSEERANLLGVKKADLETIFSSCQTISNHLANVSATQGMLNKEHFDKMLPYATFINTGRGQQVVEADLIKALKDIPTRTAVLDVTYPEPPLEDSEFFTMDNVFLTPHIAGSNGNEVARMSKYMFDELVRWLCGEDFKYEVSLEMLVTMA